MGYRKSRISRPELHWPWKVVMFILPVGFQFGSFVPLFAFAWVLGRILSIPWSGVPVRDHPNGLLWILLFLMAIPLFHLSGALLGFSLNAWILRRYLGFSWETVSETGLCPEILVRWFDHLEGRHKPSKKAPQGNDPLYDPQLDHSV
jgi:hypothetical protein